MFPLPAMDLFSWLPAFSWSESAVAGVSMSYMNKTSYHPVSMCETCTGMAYCPDVLRQAC